jgi:acetyltransferase-like isoleucine patch superfamily enzyme
MLLRELGKAWHLARSVPKSLLFNLRYFSFAQALRLPVLVSHRVKMMKLGGAVSVASHRFGSVKLGFQGSDAFSVDGTYGVWCLMDTGRIRFGDNVHLGPGVRVHCSGELELGAGISSNANTGIFCAKRIRIGRGSLLAWNVTLMDHDFHAIMQDGAPVNAPADIEIGELVWLGANSTILKGVRMACGCVAGACAVVHGNYDEENCVVAGNPARIIRRRVVWRAST